VTKDYPANWEEVSTEIKEQAGWRCEACGTENGPIPSILTVHHLDGDKQNLQPWNLAALCQKCHLRTQATIDFHQAVCTGVYPDWLKAHVAAYRQHWPRLPISGADGDIDESCASPRNASGTSGG
jgi:hypothetical protein